MDIATQGVSFRHLSLQGEGFHGNLLSANHWPCERTRFRLHNRMMKLSRMGWYLLGIAILALAQSASAEEQSTRALEQKLSPVSSSSIPTPAISTTEGLIKELSLKFFSPRLRLTESDGKAWTFQLDRKKTTVWKGTERLNLTKLKAGDRVRVRHTKKNKKEIAESVDLL